MRQADIFSYQVQEDSCDYMSMTSKQVELKPVIQATPKIAEGSGLFVSSICTSYESATDVTHAVTCSNSPVVGVTDLERNA